MDVLLSILLVSSLEFSQSLEKLALLSGVGRSSLVASEVGNDLISYHRYCSIRGYLPLSSDPMIFCSLFFPLFSPFFFFLLLPCLFCLLYLFFQLGPIFSTPLLSFFIEFSTNHAQWPHFWFFFFFFKKKKTFHVGKLIRLESKEAKFLGFLESLSVITSTFLIVTIFRSIRVLKHGCHVLVLFFSYLYVLFFCVEE